MKPVTTSVESVAKMKIRKSVNRVTRSMTSRRRITRSQKKVPERPKVCVGCTFPGNSVYCRNYRKESAKHSWAETEESDEDRSVDESTDPCNSRARREERPPPSTPMLVGSKRQYIDAKTLHRMKNCYVALKRINYKIHTDRNENDTESINNEGIYSDSEENADDDDGQHDTATEINHGARCSSEPYYKPSSHAEPEVTAEANNTGVKVRRNRKLFNSYITSAVTERYVTPIEIGKNLYFETTATINTPVSREVLKLLVVKSPKLEIKMGRDLIRLLNIDPENEDIYCNFRFEPTVKNQRKTVPVFNVCTHKTGVPCPYSI